MLSWGTGERRLEMFLEPTCRPSGRAFTKIMPLLAAVGESNLTVVVWLHSQPWHTFSSVVCRAVLASATMEEGRENALCVMNAVYANREAFVLKEHATGPNLDLTPGAILKQINALSKVDVSSSFDRKDVTDAMKRHARYARQNGIHASPTFMIDGLVDSGFSSGDDVATWAARLGF